MTPAGSSPPGMEDWNPPTAASMASHKTPQESLEDQCMTWTTGFNTSQMGLLIIFNWYLKIAYRLLITGLSTLYRWFWAMLHMCMQLYAYLHYKGLEFRPLFWKFNNMPKSMCRREPGECMMTATCRWKWYTCSATLRLFKTIMRTWIFKVTWLLDIFSIN